MNFLLAAVPGEIAGPIAGAAALAIGAMWRRIVVLESQAREDFREGTKAMAEVTRAVEKLVEKVDAILDRATR